MSMQRRDLLLFGMSFAVPGGWAQNVAKPDWKPSFLDQHQNDTVIALTEAIIPATDTPGAKAALVNRYVDLFLRDGDSGFRTFFMSGLNWLDGYSIQKHGHPFVKLTPAQQNGVLQTIDAPGGPEAGVAFFRNAKAVTSRIYYNTQAGYRELNKGGRVPADFGCNHKSHG